MSCCVFKKFKVGTKSTGKGGRDLGVCSWITEQIDEAGASFFLLAHVWIPASGTSHVTEQSLNREWLEVGMNACKKSVHQRSRLHSDWHILWTLPSLLPVSAFDFSKGLSHPDLTSQRPAYQGAVAFDRWVKQDTQKLKALVRNRIQVSCWIHTPVLRLTTLDSILKSTDITLLTKVYVVKAMVFLH